MHFRTMANAQSILVPHFAPAAQQPPGAGDYKTKALFCSRAEAMNSSVLKRSLDIIIASSLLVFLLPSLLLIALIIRWDSDGPALFRQKRFGRGGRVFTLLKFRSMCVQESEGAFIQARSADPRVTTLGRWLRRTSIDELPQLINVLRGDMSLVGPRPHALAMDQYYADLLPRYSDRLLVRPGLTGLAQISGLRGPTNTMDQMARRLRRDRAYVRRWSPLLDLKILARTPRSLFGPNAL
jgi:putative colanic acid biosysnthesis UDP-glucose lipid carrier transferase